ncbi:extracellular solute-binding protein [Pseudomonas putida]|uniref:extracellular solute-binding protein n=1 Tax=Pseudomonas putida TaxID=303 RepID=UPI0009A182D9|nr:extracellular solute-binding protein [Pseudomonas putida]
MNFRKLRPFLAASFLMSQAVLATPQPALTLYGDTPRYAAGFEHWDYVNPNAPKGGILRMALPDPVPFDHLIPYVDDGMGLAQIDQWVYSPLAVQALDDPYAVYGLVAQGIETAPDSSWVRFSINPAARFADGTPITARDVKYTFDLLMTQGSLRYRMQYAGVKSVTVESDREVRFEFKTPGNRKLAMSLADLRPLPEHWWKSRDFSKGGGFEPPLGSGPYHVFSVDPGRSVVFARNPEWWGKDLPVNKGQYNFERIKVDVFTDDTVARQVLIGGDYDLRIEKSAAGFAVGYQVDALKDGRLQKDHLAKGEISGPQGFIFNLQRPALKDVRTRQAVAQLWDFEWTNRSMYYNQYQRLQSFFPNSNLAATALPDEQELAILEPFRNEVPEQVFKQVFQTPTTDGSGDIRDHQLAALELLKAAGWRPKGKYLVDAEGQPLVINFIAIQKSFERVFLPFKRNLAQIGVTLNIRILDAAQFQQRLMRRDFDLTISRLPMTAAPGRELFSYFGSAAATDPGAMNFFGLKSPVVDRLIDGVVNANSQGSLIHHARALDRVLQWNYYWIPSYANRGTGVVWWNRFGRPAKEPELKLSFDTWWQVSEVALNSRQMEQQVAATANHSQKEF